MKRWGEVERLLLLANYADSRTDDLAKVLGRPVGHIYQMADRLGLRKSAAYLESDNACRIQRGKQHESMKATQFKPGSVSWNKGKHYVAGGRSAETRFKAGAQPQTWRAIGTYAVDGDGLLKLKVSDLRDPPRRDWIYVHRQVWERANGPIPPGGIVRFKEGRKTADKALIVPDALELVTRAENLRRNSVHNLPKELALLVQLRGALNRQINRKARDGQENHGNRNRNDRSSNAAEDDQRPA